MDNRRHPYFFKKCNLRITKDYRGITFTAIAAKVYNKPASESNPSWNKKKKFLGKIRMTFGAIDPQFQSLTIYLITKGVHAKNLEATLLFADFIKAFDSILKGKMEQMLLAYGLPKETLTAINDALQKHKSNGLLTWWKHQFL